MKNIRSNQIISVLRSVLSSLLKNKIDREEINSYKHYKYNFTW